MPSEEELLESATMVCNFDKVCSGEPRDAEEFQFCVDIVRAKGPIEVNECDWKWLLLNDCIVDLTCEDYYVYDATMNFGCGEEFQEWKTCRRELSG